MDPAPENTTPRKHSKERRLQRLSSLHKIPSSAKLTHNTAQNSSQAITPNPAICITPEPLPTDSIQLQRTFSSLLRDSSSHTETQSFSSDIYSQPEQDLKQPLLPPKNIPNKKNVPILGLKNIGKSSSLSESPTTSPRKKGSPSHFSHKKLTTSSPYSSPREGKSPHSSPREVTYGEVIKAFIEKSEITKTVKGFLRNNNNNPNQQDKDTGLTILHRAVLLHREKVTELILSDPRTNSFIEDNNSRKPSDFVRDEIVIYEKLFRALKMRETVDLIINALIITNPLLQNPQCLQESMRGIINTFLEKTLPNTLPTYIDSDFFIAAIRYRQADQLSLLKDFHKKFKKNPNHQDKLGNTMWHYAAIALDELVLTRLASNPDLDSGIRNKENCISAQLIPSSNNIKAKHLTDAIILKIQYLKYLRTLLFTRNSLELLSEQEAPKIATLICPIVSQFTLYKEIEQEGTFTKVINPDLIKAKKLIQRAFEHIASKQGDSALPETTQFPLYATDEFTYALLMRKIQSTKIDAQQTALTEPTSQQDLNNLLEVIKKESDLILSGQTKLNHIVIEKKSEQKKAADTISQPINDQDPLVSKSSED